MRPPVDDSATATVSPRSLRSVPTELARVCSGDGMVGGFLLATNGGFRHPERDSGSREFEGGLGFI